MKKSQNLQRMFAEHAIYRDEYWHSPGGRAIREIVFGFNDGLVSTLGFVVGVAGAIADQHIVLVTGLAEVMAGCFSMFFGGYLSTKNQREFFQKEIDREKFEIENMPEKEKDEVRSIYAAKGFKGNQLEAIVDHITSDRNLWLKCMMEEELGLIFESMDNPLKVGSVTGFSFMMGGFVPLIPFVFFGSIHAIHHSIILSAVALFGIGVIKTHLTKKNWLASGFESFVIGLLATAVGLLFGKVAAHFGAGKIPL